VERVTVHVVEHDGDPAGAVAAAELDDLEFVVAVPRGALVVDPDAALWAYSQYGATIVAACDGEVLAGPVWAIVAIDHAVDVDVEFDEEMLLGLRVDGGVGGVAVRGVRIAIGVVAPAVVVADGLAAKLADVLRTNTHLRADMLEYRPRRIAGGLPRIVAPEILQLPFFTADAAAALVALAEDTDLWGSDPEDPVPGDEVSLTVLSPRLFARVEDHFDALVIPALRAHWPEIAWNGMHDAFVIRYDATDGTASTGLRLHHDVAQISGAVRLNDGYVGGALEFPRQGWSNAAAPVGDLIVWPSLVTHPHASGPVTRGTKYGLTIWLRLPD
jgi:hypothetical protein